MRQVLAQLFKVALTGFLFVTPGTGFAQSYADQSKPSVVQLIVSGFDPDGRKTTPSSGSGFVVHHDQILKETFLFTAAHVIGRSSDWLQDGNKVKDRTIEVRQEQENGEISTIAPNATVIDQDDDVDVAVLAIPTKLLPQLVVATTEQIKPDDSLELMGFPADQSAFIPKVVHVRRLNVSKAKIEVDGIAEDGQSGGPVIDAYGRVVSIVSENNSKQNPRWHTTALASAAVALLNRYLDSRGRPKLALDRRSTVGSFAMLTRTGKTKVSLSGSGGGDFANTLASEQGLDNTLGAQVAATGAERSECDESSGRTKSRGRAGAIIESFELTGLKMRFDLRAHGGHYRTAVTCIAGRPVGLTGHDTQVTSSVEAFGELPFQAGTVPFDLRIIWQNMPKESHLQLISPDSYIHSEITTDRDAERVVRIDRHGNWIVRVTVSAQINAEGGGGSAELTKQPMVFLAER